MEESHIKEQSPQAVMWEVLWARRSKMAARWVRTRVWAMGGFFFWRKTKCVGAGISGGGPHGAHEAGAPPRGVGARCALVAKWWGPLVALLHFFLHACSSSSSQKNHQQAQARVLAHFAAIFDLLAQSSIHKTALGDCSLVCDSSNGPISFCSSALFIAIFCYLDDPVLEIACQIYVVKSSFNAWYGL